MTSTNRQRWSHPDMQDNPTRRQERALTMDATSGKKSMHCKKSKAVSCTSCRQVKLRCDLKHRFPKSCSRCAATGSECKTDSSFKRVPARSRIKDLENKVKQLQQSLAEAETMLAQHGTHLSPPPGSRNNSSSYSVSEHGSYGSPDASELSDHRDAELDLDLAAMTTLPPSGSIACGSTQPDVPGIVLPPTTSIDSYSGIWYSSLDTMPLPDLSLVPWNDEAMAHWQESAGFAGVTSNPT